MSRKLLICLGVLASSITGCGNKSGDGDQPPAPGCVDLSALPSSPQISFQTDLMPIFGLSCIASSCHDPTAHKADLILGDPAACGPMGTSCYDVNAKWKYTFKMPIPDALKQTVLGSLLAPSSKTVQGVRRVAPGQPEASFLIDKISGQENSKQYPAQCVNQDTTKSQTPCGTDMPLGSANWCADGDPGSAAKVVAIAQWIQQGAQNN